MKLARFDDDRLGWVDGADLIDVSAALAELPAERWPLRPGDPLIRYLDEIEAAVAAAIVTGARKPIAEVCLKSPLTSPSKIIAAPVNYQKHLDEAATDAAISFGRTSLAIDDLGLFLKAPTALVGPGDGVELSWPGRRIDHEVELAVIIGKPGRGIDRARASAHIAGYAIGLDMTVRGTEDRSLRKSFDSFAVLGPWFVSADEIADPGALDLSLKVNGEERQQSNTSQLIWDIPKLIEYASSAYTLFPGDIIMTGTPEGVGPVNPGDVMTCRIEGIGEMTVRVR